MKINYLLEKYYNQTLAIRGNRSQREELSHINSLKYCFKVLKIEFTRELTEETGYKLISHFKTNTANSNTTIRKRITFLKRVLKTNGIKTTFYDVELPRKDTKPFKKFTEQELRKIFYTLSEFKKSKNKTANTIMYELLIYLLLDTGCRIGELLEIKKENINFKDKIIILEYTKSGNIECVPFSNFSEPLIKEIIKLTASQSSLFYNILKDRKLSYSLDIRNFMRRLSVKTGIHIHAHRFRKTYGTMIYNQTNDIRLVQKLLRHSRTSTTEIYISETQKSVNKKYSEASKIFHKFKSSD